MYLIFLTYQVMKIIMNYEDCQMNKNITFIFDIRLIEIIVMKSMPARSNAPDEKLSIVFEVKKCWSIFTQYLVLLHSLSMHKPSIWVIDWTTSSLASDCFHGLRAIGRGCISRWCVTAFGDCICILSEDSCERQGLIWHVFLCVRSVLSLYSSILELNFKFYQNVITCVIASLLFHRDNNTVFN